MKAISKKVRHAATILAISTLTTSFSSGEFVNEPAHSQEKTSRISYCTDVSPSKMQQVYDEIKTSYKYGLVLIPEKNKMVDSPSIFRYQRAWYMIYIVYDGRGYETWIARSANLLQWTTMGRIMSFTDNT